MDNTLIKIDSDKVTLTNRGVVIQDGLTFDEWVAVGKPLLHCTAHLNWYLGDWLFYGAKQYGDKSRLAYEYADMVGVSPEQLRYCILVSGSVKLALRSTSLSWSHHKEVCGLTEPYMRKWLKRAEDNKWSVADLRIAIRRDCASYAPDDGKPSWNPVRPLGEIMRCVPDQPVDRWTVEACEFWVSAIERLLPMYQQAKERVGKK